MYRKFLCIFATAALAAGCATESSKTIEAVKVSSYNTPYHGARAPISIGSFDNRSTYQRGVFSDGEDRLGSQAKTILLTHLQQTNRFNVLNRTQLSALKQEAGIGLCDYRRCNRVWPQGCRRPSAFRDFRTRQIPSRLCQSSVERRGCTHFRSGLFSAGRRGIFIVQPRSRRLWRHCGLRCDAERQSIGPGHPRSSQ